MPQYLVERPEKSIYSTSYKVLSSDINIANHLAAARILPICTEVQLDFFQSLGYRNPMEIEGCGLIMVNVQTDFLGEVKYPATLQVEVAIAEFGNKSMDLVFCFTDVEKGTETARLKARYLFFNYQSEKVETIPESFRNKLSEH